MASIGHIAVGMAAGKLYGGERRAVVRQAVFAALSMLPDADVVGFKFGVRYADPWGHRGATHSLAVATLVTLACAVIARGLREPSPAKVAALAFVTVASHGLLDAMTNGGLGVALLWPFDLTRYFAPWRPIPVAPIGARFLSPRGLVVAAWELVVFAPLFAYALWPRSSASRGSTSAQSRRKTGSSG